MKKRWLFMLLCTVFLNAKSDNLTILYFTTVVSQSSQHLTSTVKQLTKKESFLRDNFEEIQIDIAKGEGEYLDTLASLYQIQNIEEWKAYLQINYASHIMEI